MLTRKKFFLYPLLASSLLLLPRLAGASPGAYDEPAAEEEEHRGVGLVPTASFFSRYEVREGYDALGKTSGRFSESDYVRYRARLGLRTTPIGLEPGRSVILYFAPQASGYWADRDSTLSEGTLGLHEASLRLQDAGFWVDAGRFEMVYGEHLVIGNVDWHETARSFDGVRGRARLAAPGAYLDAFFTQVAEDPDLVKPLGAGDQYFMGLYAGLGPLLAEALELDTYLLGQLWPKRGGMDPADLGLQLTLGTRVKKSLGRLDLRAEGGVQTGLGSIDSLAYQIDAEIGGQLSDALRLAGGGWYASGDDADTVRNEAWDQLYPTAHKFMGLADIIGPRSNITGGQARLRFAAPSEFSLGADGLVFFRPQTGAGVDAYTGFELDTWGLRPIGKGLGLRAGYSLFVPNADGPYATDELAHYVELQLRYDLRSL